MAFDFLLIFSLPRLSDFPIMRRSSEMARTDQGPNHPKKQKKEKGMKKTILAVLLVLLWTASAATAAELKVGDKAADFSLNDSKGKPFTLQAPEFKGKVISIFYAGTGEADDNNPAQDALHNDKGLDRKTGYVGIGVANLKSSLVPNFVIKSVIKKKQDKTGATILLDPDYTLINIWGLKNKASNVVVLDKDRICRYLYKGKMPQAEVAKLLSVIKEYQVK